MNVVEEIDYFSLNDKLKIQNQIEQLKNDNIYKQIFYFIITQKIKYSENTNGVFFNLNKLTNNQLTLLNNMIESFHTLNNKTELDKTYEQYSTEKFT